MITVLILIHSHQQMLHLKLILEDPISPISEMKSASMFLLPLLELVGPDTAQFVMSLQETNLLSTRHVSLRPIIKNVITINSVALKFVKEKVPLDS